MMPIQLACSRAQIAYTTASPVNTAPPIHSRRHDTATTARSASIGETWIAKSRRPSAAVLPGPNASSAKRLRKKHTATPSTRGAHRRIRSDRSLIRTSGTGTILGPSRFTVTRPELSGSEIARRLAQRGPRQDPRRVERGERRVGFRDEERYLGAAQHDGVAAALAQPADQGLHVRPRPILEAT